MSFPLGERLTLEERESLARSLEARDAEPLPSLLPPEGVSPAPAAAIAKALQRGTVHVAGALGASPPWLAAQIARQEPVVLVVEGAELAARRADDLAFFLGDARGVLSYTPPDHSPYAEVGPDRRSGLGRMATLARLGSDPPFRALVVCVSALCRRVVPPRVVRNATERLAVEATLDRGALCLALEEAGYLRVPVVEDPASFAVRGALFDVWPAGEERPFRVEFYNELVLSIHPFDPDTQRTIKDDNTVDTIMLPPARDAILNREHIAAARERISQLADMLDYPTTKTRALIEDVTLGRAFFGADGYLPAYYGTLSSLFDFFPAGARYVLEDPPALTRALREELARAERDRGAHEGVPQFLLSTFYDSEETLAERLAEKPVVAAHRTLLEGSAGPGLEQFETGIAEFHTGANDHEDLARAMKRARADLGKGGLLVPLVRRLLHWQDHGLRVVLTARTHTQAERLMSLVKHQGAPCRVRPEPFSVEREAPSTPGAEIVVGPLSQGGVFPADGLVFVTEEEIFGSRAHRKRKAKTKDPTRPVLEDLRALTVGDYVVHTEHGIGRYQGLVHKEVGGHTVDLIVVEYSAQDRLYLPVYRLNQIQKYSGGEAPKLDRLGGSTFLKTKARVKREVRKMADELLRLYAERAAQPGEALPEASDDYRAFEATFPFEETPDQARAIDDVNHDLETARPMDRLVCGDVGFGKTEVALRAAFRVASAGKQVALLCPTTVLAGQHARTFETRMRDHPIVIRLLSRFQSKKEQDDIVVGLREGKVDIVIGTHRLLSKDVHFKTLGLLIVDEEQRFGVAHKERIKQLKAHVDVLTLTATPIPRTLQMAITGLRDLSLMTTPPEDRRAVRTLVTKHDPQVLKEAIVRELSRGGQIFYVYNRIEGLYERAQKLSELVPTARIAVAHGQMARGTKEGEGGALEETMLDFVEGRYDILVSTAIVESGLDIPRANTMIVDRADLFGLAQLYQLRGRVGRSKERAYCYLVVPPPNTLTDETRARIEALERHTELGSGYQIAQLDMELRGGGDLLGAEQSGNVASVGFDMFCRMLEETVQELRGETVVHAIDPELSIDVEALLPESYVDDVGTRLSLYKRLASAIDEAEVSDLATEMEERFGPPPEEAKRLVELMRLKTDLRMLRVLGCEASEKGVTLHLAEDTPLVPDKVVALVRASKGAYRLTQDMRLTFRKEGLCDGTLAILGAVLADLAKCT